VCLLALAQLEELSLEVVVVGDGRGWRGHGFLFELSREVGQPAAPTGTGVVRSTWPFHPSPSELSGDSFALAMNPSRGIDMYKISDTASPSARHEGAPR
jgi:hypothetical protein